MKILERASQLQTLNSALAQVKTREGKGCLALVYGEAGIGKTSLVEHFVDEHRLKWRILQGACDSLFTPRPLGPLHDVALQISSPNGPQGQLLRLLDSESKRTAIFSACLSELQVQASIFVIEDIHWADEATLDLLKYLGRRIGQTSSLMILTYRDDEVGLDHPLRILLGDLASSQSAYRIPVGPLSQDSVQELIKDKNINPTELHRLTNGNPFYVTEVLAGESGIPEALRDAVLARAARLSASAREVLEAAAVIGSKIEPWLLSEVSRTRSALTDECISVGMLKSLGDHYTFRNELARQTILEAISAQRKIELYRLTLEVFKRSPDTKNEFARLAYYAEGAKDVKAVLESAPVAARQASALGAHRQAYAHYKTALQYADRLPLEEHAELLDYYADECEMIVQMDEAEHAQQKALHLWRILGQNEKEGRALRRLSEIVMTPDTKSEMDQYISEAIAVLEKLPPSKELARAYSHRSRMNWVVYQKEEAYLWGKRAMELAERLGDIKTLIHSLNNIGSIEMLGNHIAEGQKKLERSLKLSLEQDHHFHAARAFDNLACGLIAIHDYEKSRAYIKEGLDYCTKHDLDNGYVALLSDRIQADFEQGRWTEADKDIKASQKILVAVAYRYYVNIFQQRLKIRRGDPLDSEKLDKLREYSHVAVFHESKYLIAELFAEIEWLKDDLVQCRAEAESMFQSASQLNISKYVGRLAYWMWRAGAITEPPPNASEPYATQISGDWSTAASMWEKYDCPYEQGMALMDGDEAAQLRALEIFERLGARPIIEKLKRQMQAQGFRIPRGPRHTTQENPFSLTPREMEVLGLVVNGLGNNDIAEQLSLSIRTVEHHISSILQKMQVQSRNEAISLVLKEKLLPSE